MKLLDLSNFVLQDIKSIPITIDQIDFIRKFSSSYEQLFNKRAIKYRSMNLKDRELSDGDFKSLIIQEYTFLKRPIFIIGQDIFVGSSKKNIQALNRNLI